MEKVEKSKVDLDMVNLEIATEAGSYRDKYRFDPSGNEILECMFGRLAIHQILKHLQGKVMTIVEASIGDKGQRQAVNSLVAQEFGDKFKVVDEMAFHEFDEPGKEPLFGNVLHTRYGATETRVGKSGPYDVDYIQ